MYALIFVCCMVGKFGINLVVWHIFMKPPNSIPPITHVYIKLDSNDTALHPQIYQPTTATFLTSLFTF